MKTTRRIAGPSGRVEKRCEYCNRRESEISKSPGHLTETHLRCQPDGTMTCRRCGAEHNWKHQTPKAQIPIGITPIQLANQKRREEAAARRGAETDWSAMDSLFKELDALTGA